VRSAAALAALLLASCNAQTATPPSVSVDKAWARATLPGQTSSAAYFVIANEGGADALVSVTSPAGNASLHSSSMEGGVMRMRPMERLEVPANSTVTLSPGGAHLMLTGLKAPLAAGSSVPLELSFARSGKKHVEATVRAAGGESM
jgi:periplasmic copper chaperone A